MQSFVVEMVLIDDGTVEIRGFDVIERWCRKHGCTITVKVQNPKKDNGSFVFGKKRPQVDQ